MDLLSQNPICAKVSMNNNPGTSDSIKAFHIMNGAHGSNSNSNTNTVIVMKKL